jgi:hypothetical protein
MKATEMALAAEMRESHWTVAQVIEPLLVEVTKT